MTQHIDTHKYGKMQKHHKQSKITRQNIRTVNRPPKKHASNTTVIVRHFAR